MPQVHEYYVVAKVRSHEELEPVDLNRLAEDLATKLPPEQYTSVHTVSVDGFANWARPTWAAIFQVSPPEVH